MLSDDSSTGEMTVGDDLLRHFVEVCPASVQLAVGIVVPNPLVTEATDGMTFFIAREGISSDEFEVGNAP